jgi:hypothetical protein
VAGFGGAELTALLPRGSHRAAEAELRTQAVLLATSASTWSSAGLRVPPQYLPTILIANPLVRYELHQLLALGD